MTTTPCRRTPEAWVSDSDKVRAEAKAECATCPVLTECRAGKFTTEKFGVIAGIDYGVHVLSQRAAEMAERAVETKPCATCEGPIVRGQRNNSKWSDIRFCSRKCYWASLARANPDETKTCVECGSDYTRGKRNQKQWDNSRFCGVACRGAATRKDRAA